MSETLFHDISKDQFDDAATRDIDPWQEVSTDRAEIVLDTEARELTPKRRSFAKNVLARLQRKGPDFVSVHDSDSYANKLIESNRDAFGEVPAHIMTVAKSVRGFEEREKTRSGRKENSRRQAIKQEIYDEKHPDNGDNDGW